MDEAVNRFATELADAIAAAVSANPQVEACRAKARSLEPATWLDASDPPIYVAHGTADTVLPFAKQAQPFATTALTVLAPLHHFRYDWVEGAGHPIPGVNAAAVRAYLLAAAAGTL